VTDLPIAPQRPNRRRILTLAGAVVALALIGVGGTVVGAAEPPYRPSRIPVVGRTTTICTATKPAGNGTAEIAAVVSRQAPGRAGELTATPLGGGKPSLTITEQGKGEQVARVSEPVVLAGVGVMATASSAAVTNLATEGVDAGLMAAPCLTPGTTHWFTGLGGTDTDRTELVLTNADDTQAAVDLRFYGPDGRVVVPGSPGLVIDARDTTTVSLSDVVNVEGPLAVAVQADQGRVSVVAKRTRSAGPRPNGADWQVPSPAPALSMVIPGVPEDAGARELVVTNPGPVRASVAVSVLGLQGPYAPSGAETLEVAAESSATVDLAEGLAGEAATIRLTSDQPVTGAVVSSSRRGGAQSDLAIQSGAVQLIRSGVSAVATTRSAEGELVLSNIGTADAPVSFEVLSFDGVVLQTDDVLLAPDSTATRRLTSPSPSYVVLRVPDGSAVVGGVVLSQPEGDVAGLATIPLTSPDVASRAPQTEVDPAVGR
jgi:Family of unknown function (DUF5719)